MDVPKKHDWFNVGAIVPPLAVLFPSTLGLFTRSAVSLQAEIVWIIATVIMAFLVWLNAAKMQKGAREDRQRGQEDRTRLDKIIHLLEMPETTLEDVRRAATGINSFPNITLALQAEADKERPK